MSLRHNLYSFHITFFSSSADQRSLFFSANSRAFQADGDSSSALRRLLLPDDVLALRLLSRCFLLHFIFSIRTFFSFRFHLLHHASILQLHVLLSAASRLLFLLLHVYQASLRFTVLQLLQRFALSFHACAASSASRFASSSITALNIRSFFLRTST